MSLHRFYVPQTDLSQQTIRITDERLLHQWRRILRFTPGDIVRLFDGNGKEISASFGSLSKNEAVLQTEADIAPQYPSLELYLAWAILKRQNNELIIQKATELGVSRFLPIVAERSVRADVSATRSDRWERIAIEAAEQCGRSDIPHIDEPQTITDISQQYSASRLVYCERNPKQVDSIKYAKQSTVLFIGPEGGWSPAEKSVFTQENFTQLPLGDLTLRAETAAIVGVSRLFFA